MAKRKNHELTATAAETENLSAGRADSAEDFDGADSGDDAALDTDFADTIDGTDYGDDSDATTDNTTEDYAEPVPTRAPSARTESSRSVPRSPGRQTARKPDRQPDREPLPTRAPNEDIFDWLRRPDVSPHVHSVALRLKQFHEGGKQALAAAITIAGAPPKEVVYDRIYRPGVYDVQVFRKRDDGAQVFFGGDKNYYIDPDSFEDHKRAKSEQQAQREKAATVTAAPSNDQDWLRQQLARRDDELQRERAARLETTQQLAELRATVEALKARPAHAEQPSFLDGLNAAKNFMAGPNLELAQLDKIRHEAREEGRAAGKVEGKLAARVEAMEEAKQNLASEARRLTEYRAVLIRDRQQLDLDRAELADRTADLAEQERDLIRREARVGFAEERQEARRRAKQTQRPAPPQQPNPWGQLQSAASPANPSAHFDPFNAPPAANDPLGVFPDWLDNILPALDAPVAEPMRRPVGNHAEDADAGDDDFESDDADAGDDDFDSADDDDATGDFDTDDNEEAA